MTYLKDIPVRQLQFYITAPYPCSYLPGQIARSQVAAPSQLVNGKVYSGLVHMGFRRSGIYTYRPHCDNCEACVPVRIAVDKLEPNRAQRRAWKRHQNLNASIKELSFDVEHYALYQRYQKSRHPGGGMDQDNKEQYKQFLLQSSVDSHLVEFREGRDLKMVSIIDRVVDGLSSVYTFFEPDLAQSSLGTYNILWQADLCRQLELPHLYLGYWIASSPKMTYKINFQPIEGLIKGEWQALSPNLKSKS